MRKMTRVSAGLALPSAWLMACSSPASTSFPPSAADALDAGVAGDAGGFSPSGSSDSGFGAFVASDAGGVMTSGGDGGPLVLPSNFVPTEHGGYALGPAIEGDGADAGIPKNTGSANCTLVTGVVRDFKYQADDNNTGHPDFGTFSGISPTPGLVQAALGSDLKPVFTGICTTSTPFSLACPSPQMTTKANFDQWYRYAPGVNKPFLVYLQFVPNGSVYTFESDLYFTLD
ncbi:MAG: hypothetical protein ACREJ3_02640, partial [Polyangiaceae bacterium]